VIPPTALQIAGGQVTNRVTLTVAGNVWRRWTEVTITRDLREIAGSFDLRLYDESRAALAETDVPVRGQVPPPPLAPGQACRLAIDGETVLVGWIEDVDVTETGTAAGLRVAGRDRTGDLVDCAACPTGPAEFRGLTLTQIARQICAPFGIPVQAQVDVGEAFARLALNPHETALSTIEKAARQRAVLVVSDGVGGLLLTRGGINRAPWHLWRGDNIAETRVRSSWRGRFSDVWVKGQSELGAGGRHRQAAAVPMAAAPSGELIVRSTTPAAAAAGVLMTGYARDPEITRWRPHVRLTRSQSGMSSTQEQAEWVVRVLRGEGDQLHYTVLDWRAGPDQALWRPNEVVDVYDPFGGITKDMLVAGITYRLGREGLRTVLRVVGVTAYDRINEASRRRRKHDKHSAAPLRVVDPTAGGV
jgi:prophage tail gpP-like protein